MAHRLESRFKQDLDAVQKGEFNAQVSAKSIYRPFDGASIAISRRVLLTRMPMRETENRFIWKKTGSEFLSLALLAKDNAGPMLPQGGSQCFPFYTYAEDGTQRRENITDWALEQFRSHYDDPSITKWDIFHYIYAVLHHPEYRERYAANLRRELPRIPFASASTLDTPASTLNVPDRTLNNCHPERSEGSAVPPVAEKCRSLALLGMTNNKKKALRTLCPLWLKILKFSAPLQKPASA